MADEHTLVKYFRERIIIYKEVKSTQKWAFAAIRNVRKKMVQRSKLLFCPRCSDANYCSRDCQVTDRPRHKISCDSFVSRMAIVEELIKLGGISPSIFFTDSVNKLLLFLYFYMQRLVSTITFIKKKEVGFTSWWSM